MCPITFDNEVLEQYCLEISEAQIHKIFMIELMSFWLL